MLWYKGMRDVASVIFFFSTIFIASASRDIIISSDVGLDLRRERKDGNILYEQSPIEESSSPASRDIIISSDVGLDLRREHKDGNIVYEQSPIEESSSPASRDIIISTDVGLDLRREHKDGNIVYEQLPIEESSSPASRDIIISSDVRLEFRREHKDGNIVHEQSPVEESSSPVLQTILFLRFDLVPAEMDYGIKISLENNVAIFISKMFYDPNKNFVHFHVIVINQQLEKIQKNHEYFSLLLQLIVVGECTTLTYQNGSFIEQMEFFFDSEGSNLALFLVNTGFEYFDKLKMIKTEHMSRNKSVLPQNNVEVLNNTEDSDNEEESNNIEDLNNVEKSEKSNSLYTAVSFLVIGFSIPAIFTTCIVYSWIRRKSLFRSVPENITITPSNERRNGPIESNTAIENIHDELEGKDFHNHLLNSLFLSSELETQSFSGKQGALIIESTTKSLSSISSDSFCDDNRPKQLDFCYNKNEGDLYVVTVPPGKLGIGVKSVHGATLISKVAKGSPVEGNLSPGDRVVAINDVDVRAVHGDFVANLMLSDMNKNRKMTLIKSWNKKERYSLTTAVDARQVDNPEKF